MNKHKILYDGSRSEDTAHLKSTGQHRGHVIAYVKGTDKVLFEEDNKVIIPGSAFTAAKHFKDLSIPVKTPTYNTALGLDNIVSITPAEEVLENYVYLFAVGIGGCGPEDSQKYDVDYTKWIAPEELVPFRYQLLNNDLSDDLRAKYFGRKEMAAADRIAYYFKAFDQDPVFKQRYIDGTPIDENIYISDNTMDVESFVELKLSITKRDCRDFFVATTGINDARINTISLLTAVPKSINGFTYYQNIRPLTKLNFNNESLIDETKGIDITYQIFY